MNMPTLKGFRDFLPAQAKKRQFVINTLKSVFESYGFEPLETPALEYENLLLGKYGEEGNKLMYRFKDQGERNVAMRYDQTVPLARVVSEYKNSLPIPFKRYQIQPVWRAENTQKGRYREFLQCDADIVGLNTPLSDSEVILTAISSLKKLGFKKFKTLLNDRNNFSYFQKTMRLTDSEVTDIIRGIDKLKKIGREGVLNELGEKIGFEKAEEIVESISNIKATERVLEVMNLLKKGGLNDEMMQFYPPLARGLDYYTGIIFEIEISGYQAGSVCGGGRYDKLIGMFSGTDIPAVGFAFGFDRLLEAMEELKLFPEDIDDSVTRVLVTVFSQNLLATSEKIASMVRNEGINAELYLDETSPLDKQLKYANNKNIPFVLIIGPQEAEKDVVTLKNMKTGEQKTMSQETLPDEIAK